jgi:hypothetical protein
MEWEEDTGRAMEFVTWKMWVGGRACVIYFRKVT